MRRPAKGDFMPADCSDGISRAKKSGRRHPKPHKVANWPIPQRVNLIANRLGPLPPPLAFLLRSAVPGIRGVDMPSPGGAGEPADHPLPCMYVSCVPCPLLALPCPSRQLSCVALGVGLSPANVQ